MAKVIIPPGSTWLQVSGALKELGITLDRHRLPDGSYRAYVRKDKLNLLLSHLNTQPL